MQRNTINPTIQEDLELIEFKFIGFELEDDDKYQNEEFLQLFEKSSFQKNNNDNNNNNNNNNNDDAQITQLSEYKEKTRIFKEQIGLLQSKLEYYSQTSKNIQNKQSSSQFDGNIKLIDLQKENNHDNYDNLEEKQEDDKIDEDINFETEKFMEEYEERNKILNKYKKQLQDENIKQKIQINQQMQNLQKSYYKQAWMLLYQNKEIIQKSKKCIISSSKQYQNLSFWLYLTLIEISKFKDINELTIDLSNCKLSDQNIKIITNSIFQIINQLDHITIYKLILSQNNINNMNNLILLFPRNITYLKIDLSYNELQNEYFTQMYIPQNVQKFILNISNNSCLTSQALYYLGKKLHQDLEIELEINNNTYNNNINSYDVLIDYVGKCHSLKINSKSIMYNDSFQLDVSIENINQKQFENLISSIYKNVILESNNNNNNININSNEIHSQNNINNNNNNNNNKYYYKHNIREFNQQSFNLIEDNKERSRQLGSNQILTLAQQSQSSNEESIGDYKLQQQQQQCQNQNENVKQEEEQIEVQNQINDIESKNDSEIEEDVDITEKKDFILTINEIKILDTTQDDCQYLTLNLTQFDVDIFYDRLILYWINSLPKIPASLLINNLEFLDERLKIFILLILSKKEKIVYINETMFDMNSFSIDYSLFVEFEQDQNFLYECLLSNQMIEELEIIILNTDLSEKQIHELIYLFDNNHYSMNSFKKLIIKTDLEGNFMEQYHNHNNNNNHQKRKYQLIIQQQNLRKCRLDSIDYKDYGIFNLVHSNSKSKIKNKKIQQI